MNFKFELVVNGYDFGWYDMETELVGQTVTLDLGSDTSVMIHDSRLTGLVLNGIVRGYNPHIMMYAVEITDNQYAGFYAIVPRRVLANALSVTPDVSPKNTVFTEDVLDAIQTVFDAAKEQSRMDEPPYSTVSLDPDTLATHFKTLGISWHW